MFSCQKREQTKIFFSYRFQLSLIISNFFGARSEYYKWQSKQAIFITKKGNASCHKYIGKAGSSKFIKAVEIMQRRTKIEALQQVQHTLDLGLMDLVEESTRNVEKRKKPEI